MAQGETIDAFRDAVPTPRIHPSAIGPVTRRHRRLVRRPLALSLRLTTRLTALDSYVNSPRPTVAEPDLWLPPVVARPLMCAAQGNSEDYRSAAPQNRQTFASAMINSAH